MEQEDTLENCLLSLSKQYPEKHVEVNNDALRSYHVHLSNGTFSKLREQLQSAAPNMLQETAHVLADNHVGEIYLLSLSETEHIFLYRY
jgi:hypothetical protein